MESTSTAPASAAIEAGSRLKIDDPDAFKPGNVTLSLHIFGKDGQELTPEDLKVVHDKRLHLLLVRDDMTQFQHLHPEYTNEEWTVTTTIPEQGDYQLYTDISPEKEAPVILRTPIRVGGTTITKTFPTPNAGQTAMDGDVLATLTSNGVFKTSEAKELTFALTKNGQPVKNIEPYLGAFGHVVILRHNAPDEFLHVHPITETKPADEKVVFGTTFTTPGRYTLYAQFNIGGAVKTFPITIDIVDNTGTTQMQNMDHMHHGER